MRIFLTGATGYIGSAVLDAFVRAGHQVTALVRDPARAELLSSRGTVCVVGELANSSTFAAAARTSDALVHTAFEGSKRGPAVDRQAIDALLEAAQWRRTRGNPTAVVYTSGVWVLGSTQGEADEEAPVRPTPLVAWRPEQSFRVAPELVRHRHALTPYMDRELLGVIDATYLRGTKVYDRGTLTERPTGELLTRGHAQIPFVNR